jgi:hypothetical protein
MLRITVFLLLLSACTGQREEDSTAAAPAQVSSENPALFRRSQLAASAAENSGTFWADSTRRGDTTFFGRGRVVTTSVVYLDSQWVRIPDPPVRVGIPVGLFATWDGTALQPNTEMFTLTYGGETPATLPARLAVARSRGIRMVVAMTGGARANYLTSGVFDMAKWRARMKTFDTPEIRAAVAEAVRDGILLGNSVMDEPFNDGGPGNQSNSWGPAGTMSKARVDSMCGMAKAIFPSLPQGVFQDYRLAPNDSYRVCDFITSQYRTAKGTATEYRDGALELCRRDHHACSFAINVLDGGIQVKRQPGQTDYLAGDCPLSTTGGRGTYFPNCRMTAAQVRESGKVLGPEGCFLTGWRYNAEFMASPENQAAFRDVAATLASRSGVGCIRT